MTSQFFARPLRFEPDGHDQGPAIRAAEEKVAAERGLWALADLYVPPDVREMAARWKLENTLVEMWRDAFIEGWRAALRTDRPTTGPKDGGEDAG